MINQELNISKFQSWILASRPRTLPAALVPVMVGSALAVHDGKFNFRYSFVALLCSILIQVGTNFTNDLYDYLKGADNENRKGPLRVLVSHLISKKEMTIGIILVFSAAFLLGLFLVYSTSWVILIVGIVSILAGLAYTAGPFPLAYNGLGDVFVFIFFGLVGTCGTYFLHHQNITLESILASIPVGALITNILVVNNFRDIKEDREAGKYTLAVKLGEIFSFYQYMILSLLAFLVPLIFFVMYDYHFLVLLPLISLPIIFKLIKMLNSKNSDELNKALELTAKESALFGLLFSIGLIV